jgi:hypothetical protein
MAFKSAKTRLRRTFAYPSDTTSTSSSRQLSSDDDDEDDDGPAYDEQEQEDLIRALAHQNEARNAQFRIFLLALPALSTVPYVLVLLGSLFKLISASGGGGRGSGSGGTRPVAAADTWIALLALSSLASTTWTLYSLPPGATGIRALDTWIVGSSSSSSDSNSNSDSSYNSNHNIPALGPIGPNAQRRRRYSSGAASTVRGYGGGSPLEQYLPFLNMALCGLLVLTGILSSRSAAAPQRWGHVGLANLPAVVYAVVLVAKMLMGSVDPERELSALRYEYKGA